MIDRRITPAEVWPRGWKRLVTQHPLGVGIDLGTTTKKKSNPTAIAFTQRIGEDFFVRACVRFKTELPEVIEAVLKEGLNLPEHARVRKICVAATSERLWAAKLRSALAGKQVVELVIESENIEFAGETMLKKVYLGNLVVNGFNDGRLFIPDAAWLKNDIRSVQKDKGSFTAEVDENGNHADCFVAIGMSLHALIGSGPVEAAAAQVGRSGARRHAGRGSMRPNHDDDRREKGARIHA